MPSLWPAGPCAPRAIPRARLSDAREGQSWQDRSQLVKRLSEFVTGWCSSSILLSSEEALFTPIFVRSLLTTYAVIALTEVAPAAIWVAVAIHSGHTSSSFSRYAASLPDPSALRACGPSPPSPADPHLESAQVPLGET